MREAADIAAPTASWNEVAPGRPAAASSVGYVVAGPFGADARLDLDGDGRFDDAGPGGNVRRAFGGPATIALRAVDAFGRTAETTTQVPFGAGNFGPDAVLAPRIVDAPLTAVFARAKLWGYARDVEASWVPVAWDTDGDGEFDDPAPTGTEAAGTLPASVAVRATDADGDTVTLRRSLAPASPLEPTTPSARLQAVGAAAGGGAAAEARDAGAARHDGGRQVPAAALPDQPDGQGRREDGPQARAAVPHSGEPDRQRYAARVPEADAEGPARAAVRPVGEARADGQSRRGRRRRSTWTSTVTIRRGR